MVLTTQVDRRTLLSVARSAISDELDGVSSEPRELLPPGAASPAGGGGVFVTLKIAGALRGCIGHTVSDAPVAKTVAKTARSAAFADPRFPPLTRSELEKVSIEISRLSEFFPISPDAVEVGKHGLLLRLGYRSGLLLPQVPGEQGWDREAFLSGLCRKSGLLDGSWNHPDAILEAFTAEVFAED